MKHPPIPFILFVIFMTVFAWLRFLIIKAWDITSLFADVGISIAIVACLIIGLFILALVLVVLSATVKIAVQKVARHLAR